MLPRKVKYPAKKRFSFYQSLQRDGIALSADLNGGGAQRRPPVVRNRRASRELPIARAASGPAAGMSRGVCGPPDQRFWFARQWRVAGATSWRRVRLGRCRQTRMQRLRPGDGVPIGVGRSSRPGAYRNAATVYAAGQSSSNCRVSSVCRSICTPSRIAASFCSIQS